MVALTDGKKPKSLLWRVLFGVCAAIFLAALVMLLLHLFPRGGTVVPESAAPVSEVILVDNPIDFAALQANNPDVKAWIRVPGTVIDYAVMQSGEDTEEDFYLHHAEDKSYRYAGSIYMQKMNNGDFTDPHTVLYGHNMRNGSMFAAVHKFKKKDFFEENQYIYVYTPGHILTYRIFSTFVYDDRHLLYAFNFNDRESYADFLEQALHPASMTRQVRQDVTVTPDDRIITLSTCTDYNMKQRVLLEGVLIRDELTK